MSDRSEKFLVWREAEALSWRCTLKELAEATGLPASRVAFICRQKKWAMIAVDEVDLIENHY